MKTTIKILIGFVAICLASHLMYSVFDYFFNADFIFVIALILTVIVFIKGVKADFKKEKHSNNKNNAY